jgi:hypothetical protein
MAAESKSLIPEIATDPQLVCVQTDGSGRTPAADLSGAFEIGLVFALIMAAVWPPQGRFNTISSLMAAICILWFTVGSRYSMRELGLGRPGSGVIAILVSGAVMVVPSEC